VVKRKYVIPGELVAEGSYHPVANILRIGERFYSTRVGMAEVSQDKVRVIPLSGPYIPKVDDLVLGKIVNYSAFAWEVDINSCFFAYLPAQSVFDRNYSPAEESLSDKFDIGDLLVARVMAFDRTRDPLLTISGQGLGGIPQGEIVKIAPIKVPRLIGKKGTMIKTIEAGTGCRLIIGQNGLIVVTGAPENVLKTVEVIRLVEEEAHTVNLSEKVQSLLAQSRGD
jgi:exosome complex component RRP4